MPPMTLLWAALLVAADQASKTWAQAEVPRGASRSLGWGLSLTYVENPGAAFGILRGLDLRLGPLHVDGTVLLGVLSALVAAWLVVQLLRRGTHGPLVRLAMTLILAGAVGNMIDRFRLGYVIDFLHVRWGWLDVPVFNLADSLVVVGAALLLASAFAPQRRAPAAQPPPATPEAGRRPSQDHPMREAPASGCGGEGEGSERR